MTFTRIGNFEKLENGSKQTRCLLPLAPKYEVGEILGEVVLIESGGYPEQARAISGRSENLSPNVTFWAEAGSRQMKFQLAVTSWQAIKTAKAAILKSDHVLASSQDGDGGHLEM